MQNRFALLTGMVLALLFTATLPAFAQDCTTPDGYEPEVEYFTADNVYKFCNGTEWITMGGGGDNQPDAFNFTDQTGVALSTLISSNIVQITGMDDGTSISISGDGTPAYRICADATCSTNPAFTSATGVIAANQYLQLRLTSNASIETQNTATVTVGSVSDSWNVTTAATRTVVIKSWGAGGGGANWNTASSPAADGGAGGFVTAEYVIPAGTTLAIRVGRGGLSPGDGNVESNSGDASYRGGAGSDNGNGWGGAQGGGYSGVFIGTVAHANSLAIAGGGGGGGAGSHNSQGGSGGGTSGEDGQNNTYGGALGAYGRAGTQGAGGAAGGSGATAGGALAGGNGNPNTGRGSGGGGSGYYGGGGGVAADSAPEGSASGGGGSGFIAPTATINSVSVTKNSGSFTTTTTSTAPNTGDSHYAASIAKGGTGKLETQTGGSGGNGRVIIIVDGVATSFTSLGNHTFNVP